MFRDKERELVDENYFPGKATSFVRREKDEATAKRGASRMIVGDKANGCH